MKYILTVDPSMTNIGWCLWRGDKWGTAESAFVALGTSHPVSRDPENAATSTGEAIKRLKESLPIAPSLIDVVYIEYPEYHTSAGGRVTASSGALVKLSIATGIIAIDFINSGSAIQFITPSEWKGQISKKLQRDRVKKKISEDLWRRVSKASSHAFDAFSIGLYLQR